MPRAQFKKPTLKSLLITLIVITGTWIGLDNSSISKVVSVASNHPPGYYSVASVEDGDTIVVDMNGTSERVRFIGVDTPEKHHPNKPVQCFAQAASRRMAELIGDNPVRLEADPTNQNRDRYDRLLRYVYLEDGTLLNAQQIADGYGFAYTAFPFEKMDEFRALEDSARQDGKGLWSSCQIEIDNGYINTNPV
ncbi:MAG TPA: thermonuclease family protein [Candidatus Saccharimonadales bacterium]|jgi:micrococcal nuclease